MFLYFHCGNIVPGPAELTKHKAVEILTILGQAALAKEDLSHLRGDRGVTPHPQRVSIHVFLLGVTQ